MGGEAERTALEEPLASEPYEEKSDFARKYVSEGRAEGLAQGVPRACSLFSAAAASGSTMRSAIESSRRRISNCSHAGWPARRR